MKIEREIVVLQYPPAGTRVGYDGSRTVHESEGGRFVALDERSGGYPYPTELDRAENFRTVERAQSYLGNEKFIVRRVRVTHEVLE